MPAVTYLRADEYLQPTGDREIDEALAAVRSMTGEDWRVAVYEFDLGILWWRRTRRVFGLFVGLGKLPENAQIMGGDEFQIINFPPLRGDPLLRGIWLINHDVDRALVLTYLFGICAGAGARVRIMQEART
jgi:hypothetical protein